MNRYLKIDFDVVLNRGGWDPSRSAANHMDISIARTPLTPSAGWPNAL